MELSQKNSNLAQKSQKNIQIRLIFRTGHESMLRFHSGGLYFERQQLKNIKMTKT
jgi:hypothetical protein